MDYLSYYVFRVNKKSNDKFLPWYLLDKSRIVVRFEGLKERYPKRTLFLFARHDYIDDIACWEMDKPGMIVLLHDYASEGYENRMEFKSFEDWYAFVIDPVNFPDDYAD